MVFLRFDTFSRSNVIKGSNEIAEKKTDYGISFDQL